MSKWRRLPPRPRREHNMDQQAQLLIEQLKVLPHVMVQISLLEDTEDQTVPHFRVEFNAEREPEYAFILTTSWEGDPLDVMQLCLDGVWRHQLSPTAPQMRLPERMLETDIANVNMASGRINRALANYLNQ